jgi:glycosyltransferase involved in cell wall biosynthesis
LKILSIATGMPSNIPPDNSAWIRIIKNADILSDQGNELEFLFYIWKNDQNTFLDLKFRYNVIEVLRNPLTHFKYFKKIIKGDYDLVYFNVHIPIFYIFINFFKTTVILDKHGDYIQEFLMYNNSSLSFQLIFRKIADYLDFKFSDIIICVSKIMIDSLINKGIDKNKLFYVTNGVDLDLFKVLPKTDMKPNKLVFSYIGAFDKWQGVDNFIKAAKSLRNDPELIFLIIGGVQEGSEGNIKFIPKVKPNEVFKYYNISDIFVLPRPSHPATEVAAPTKFVEYAATGKPILATNVGDAAFFVKKYKCGIVIDDNDPDSLIKGIQEFKNKNIKELEEMGKNSKEMAIKEFSYEKVGLDLIELTKKLS